MGSFLPGEPLTESDDFIINEAQLVQVLRAQQSGDSRHPPASAAGAAEVDIKVLARQIIQRFGQRAHLPPGMTAPVVVSPMIGGDRCNTRHANPPLSVTDETKEAQLSARELSMDTPPKDYDIPQVLMELAIESSSDTGDQDVEDISIAAAAAAAGGAGDSGVDGVDDDVDDHKALASRQTLPAVQDTPMRHRHQTSASSPPQWTKASQFFQPGRWQLHDDTSDDSIGV